MIRRPPRSTLSSSSAASDVYKRQVQGTVRMVGSTQANLFASVSAGVCALWGKLHGGANSAVMEMLDYLLAEKNQRYRLPGAGKTEKIPTDGLWASRLQKLRSPRSGPQTSGPRSAGYSGVAGRSAGRGPRA
eukprot:TRINITY_DN12390_c0_g1_i1.p3 TRINITY_DN12390_c0_g1~~TRINITY_DN12390_c0_g1_i1.p3  ORF type:complete len:132 (-),score=21.13 TRINITY_DN12390_c0_g1_i1:542-937(-)